MTRVPSLDDLKHEIRRFLAGLGPVPEPQIDDDGSIIAQGIVDSLGLVELQLLLEERLGREVNAGEFDDSTLLSVSSAAEWLHVRLSGAEAA
jgi:acyl carrier protein